MKLCGLTRESYVPRRTPKMCRRRCRHLEILIAAIFGPQAAQIGTLNSALAAMERIFECISRLILGWWFDTSSSYSVAAQGRTSPPVRLAAVLVSSVAFAERKMSPTLIEQARSQLQTGNRTASGGRSRRANKRK